MERIVKNGPLGLAVTLPLSVCKRWKLKPGDRMVIFCDESFIRFKKAADPIEQLRHDPDSYEDYRIAIELTELEEPYTGDFWARRKKK